MRNIAAALLIATLSAPASAAEMTGHRAVYRAEQNPALPGMPDVARISGEMTYDLTNTCTSWDAHRVMDVRVGRTDGQVFFLVSERTTREAGDGRSFQFRERLAVNGHLQSANEGSVVRAYGGSRGTVRYTQPRERTSDFPEGTLFPIAQDLALLRVLEAGQREFSVSRFDGNDMGAERSRFELQSVAPAQQVNGNAIPRIWRVQRSDTVLAAPRESPVQSVQEIWANGVVGLLEHDFGFGPVRWVLTELQLRPVDCSKDRAPSR